MPLLPWRSPLASLSRVLLPCILCKWLLRACAFQRIPAQHAVPTMSASGRYIMLWDWVMGTFRPHPQDVGSKESMRRAAAEPASYKEKGG